MMRGTVLLVLGACGRISFDPLDPLDPPTDDARPPDDGTRDTSPDTPVAACADAIALTLNAPLTIDTCTGNFQRLDGCGPAGTREVVLRFTAPTSRGYTFRAFDTGTMNVSNSTGRIDEACATVTSCAGISGFSVTAGQTVYLAVEASSGGCATIDFLVD